MSSSDVLRRKLPSDSTLLELQLGRAVSAVETLRGSKLRIVMPDENVAVKEDANPKRMRTLPTSNAARLIFPHYLFWQQEGFLDRVMIGSAAV